MRLAYYVGMVLLLVLGLYSGIAVLYVVFVLQVLVVMTVMALAIWTVRTLRYRQELSKDVSEKGSRVVIRIGLFNEKPIPLSLLEIEVGYVTERDRQEVVVSLSPFTEVEKELEIMLPYSGEYEIGMRSVKVTDIFGLTTIRFDMRKQPFYGEPKVIVIPRIEEEIGEMAETWDSKQLGAEWSEESGETMYDTREYREGDRAHRIHWIKSYRYQRLIVKRSEKEERNTVVVIMDSNVSGKEGEAIYAYGDRVREVVGGIVMGSITRGMRAEIVGMQEGGKIVRYMQEGGEELGLWLAQQKFGRTGEIGELVEEAAKGVGAGTSVYVVTRYPTADVIERLQEIRQGVNSMSMVLIDDTETEVMGLHTVRVGEREE